LGSNKTNSTISTEGKYEKRNNDYWFNMIAIKLLKKGNFGANFKADIAITYTEHKKTLI
jgi:hypothetical protein